MFEVIKSKQKKSIIIKDLKLNKELLAKVLGYYEVYSIDNEDEDDDFTINYDEINEIGYSFYETQDSIDEGLKDEIKNIYTLANMYKIWIKKNINHFLSSYVINEGATCKIYDPFNTLIKVVDGKTEYETVFKASEILYKKLEELKKG